MTLIRLDLSGIVKQVRFFTAAGKPAVEFSMCVKNKTKEGEEDSFTWAKGIVFDAPEWVTSLQKGDEVTALCGRATMRSYVDAKTNEKRTSLEAIYDKFAVQVHGQRKEATEDKPAPAPRKPAAASDDDSSPPF
jgi:hypothetical protein